jgi:hypothetical protein
MSRNIVLTTRQKIVAWTWQCYGRCFIVHMSISQIGGIDSNCSKRKYTTSRFENYVKSKTWDYVMYRTCILPICTYDKNVQTIQPLVQEKQDFVVFPRWLPGGHIWNPIRQKFVINIEGAQIYVQTRLKHSRSNSNSACPLHNLFWTLTSDLEK